MTHAELVEIAARWLNCRVGFLFKELRSLSREQPDIIGFRCGESILIECKVSRADFIADKSKPFRLNPCMGMGNYRLYCCPAGLIKKDELPDKWGLIYVDDKGRARMVKNCFNSKGGNMFLADNMFEANREAEFRMLYAALRRLNLRGRLEEIYEAPESWAKTESEPATQPSNTLFLPPTDPG